MAVLFSSCVTEQEKQDVVNESEEILPFEVTRDATIRYSDSGLVKLKIKAPTIERYAGEKPYSEFPDGVRVEFYDKSGNISSFMDAGYAINLESENKMEARYNVEVLNPEGDRLNTEKLIWEKETKQIHTDEPVKITTADEVIFGTGLVAEQDFSKYQIKNITGIINIEDDATEEEGQ